MDTKNMIGYATFTVGEEIKLKDNYFRLKSIKMTKSMELGLELLPSRKSEVERAKRGKIRLNNLHKNLSDVGILSKSLKEEIEKKLKEYETKQDKLSEIIETWTIKDLNELGELNLARKNFEAKIKEDITIEKTKFPNQKKLDDLFQKANEYKKCAVTWDELNDHILELEEKLKRNKLEITND